MPLTPKPKECKDCPLYGTGYGYSVLEGDGESGLMVVAEALGGYEEEDGLPLRPQARAGGVYQQVMNNLGLRRERMTITNVVRCRPPGNKLVGSPYERAAIGQCKQYLDQAVEIRRPRLILALGDVPLRELSAVAGTISDLRGYVLQSRYGIPMIATYHPSHIARGATHLFGAFRHDIRRAESYARLGVPEKLATNYLLQPVVVAVERLLDRLRADPGLAIAYDVETEKLLGGVGDRIIQMQFSCGLGEAMVLPYREPFIWLAKQIMELPNPKWDWNGRLFDRLVLRAHGFVLNGEFHDLMNVWGHLQPNFVSSKDATDDDDGKQIPARLMRLQAAMSFYYPNFGPWKSVEFPEWEGRWWGQELPLPVRLYGAKDVDATYRLGVQMLRELRREGLYEGYHRFKHQQSFVLDDISRNGLPVDREKQAELLEYMDKQEGELLTEVQRHIPTHLLVRYPKGGYKRDLVRVEGKSYHLNKLLNGNDAVVVGSNTYIRDVFPEGERWCRLEPFNLDSSQQLLNYIRWREYRVPINLETGRPTTGKQEMAKLYKETGDEVLRLCQKQRKLTKMKGTYCSGAWVPGPDGRVHGEFRYGTANQQISCSNPNCFSGDTELLTLQGWKNFREILTTDKVAQYEPANQNISFVEPQHFLKRRARLLEITTLEQLHLKVTSDHRCLLRHRKTKQFRDWLAASYPEDWQQIQAGWYQGGDTFMPKCYLMLIAALQADGHVCKPRGRYKGGGIEFTFSRQRKIDRLRIALEASGITYTEQKSQSTNPKHADRVRFYISRPNVPEWLKDKKRFGPWILTLDKDSFQFLADEIFYWDGLLTGRQFTSNVESDRDWAQVLLALTGRRAHPRTYTYRGHTSWQLDVTNKDYSLTTNREISELRGVPYVYCVTVPSSYLVTRLSGRIAITGNCQQFPEHYDPADEWMADIGNRVKGFIRALPGRKLVKVDARGAHARTQGWLAEDADYYRLASLDLHSFNTGLFVKEFSKDVLQLGDLDLMGELKRVKKLHKHTRDALVKRVSFLNQYGGGAAKASSILGIPEAEVQALLNQIGDTFQLSFRDFPKKIEAAMQESVRLVNAFGCCRWFWEKDLKEAIAFMVASTFHCHIQDAVIRLWEQGVLQRYEAVNFTHDAVWLHPLTYEVADAIDAVRIEFERPSKVLRNSLGAFWCSADVQVGDVLSDMTDWVL